jgi:hypothetical protein
MNGDWGNPDTRQGRAHAFVQQIGRHGRPGIGTGQECGPRAQIILCVKASGRRALGLCG